MEDEKVWGFIRSTVELAEQRFGQRLGDEIKGVRDEMAGMQVGLKGEMAAIRMGLRDEMAKMEMGLKGEMALMEKRIRNDMGEMHKDLSQSLLWRRQDIDVAFKDIESLKRVYRGLRLRVRKIEKTIVG